MRSQPRHRRHRRVRAALPDCGRETLTVTTVRIQLDDRPHVAGGWALCLHCNATPHPVMEAPRG
ncbi:hypothetical protein E4K10_30480 [Streptomyces sp. T1317-0309]|nr:hypothetical protein E4K10_30480 [Streptomyces sp. T1317-0309]